MSWLAAPLVREAACNAATNPARSLALVVIVGAAVGLLARLDLQQANDLDAFEHEFVAAGGYIAVVTSPSTPLNAGRCEALRRWPGVVAAGATSLPGAITFASAPGVLFQMARVTEGALSVWLPRTPAPGSEGYLVGAALAAEIGLRQGSLTALSGEAPVRVIATADAGPRNPRAARWLLEVVPPAFDAEECWVEFTRDAYRAGLTALPAWFTTGSVEPVVRPYVRRDEFTRDIAREFATRPQRFGWLPTGGLIVAVFLLAAWFRRSELGLYLALGSSRVELVAMLACEVALLVSLALLAAVLSTVAAERMLGHALPVDHLLLALRSVGSAALLGMVVAPGASALVARGNLQSLLKDR